MAKSQRLSVALDPSVFDFLKTEASRRGISLNAMISGLCGEWVSKIMDQKELQAASANAVAEVVRSEFKTIMAYAVEDNQIDIDELLLDDKSA